MRISTEMETVKKTDKFTIPSVAADTLSLVAASAGPNSQTAGTLIWEVALICPVLRKLKWVSLAP